MNEVRDLPTALPDEPHHDDIRLRKAGHHSQQDGLADAGASKKTQALAPANGEECIDGPNTNIEGIGHGRSPERVQGSAVQGRHGRARRHGSAVKGAAERIDDPS